jgi:hypothetical protein
MAKLSLTPNPTFKARVTIPVAGEAPATVNVTFKYRTKTQLDEFFNKELETKDNWAEQILMIAEGWDLDDEFSLENLRLLVDQRPGTGQSFFKTYSAEGYGAREKN